MVGMSADDLLESIVDAFDLFVVGTVDKTGELLLSRDARVPDEETVVFLSSDTANEMTVTEAEDALGSVTWLMEPEPYDPAAASVVENEVEDAVTVMDDGWDPMMAAITPMVAAAGDPSEEALRDEQETVVAEAEKRIAQLEGMVTEMMMSAVTDEVFEGSQSDVVVVDEAKVPRFASVTGGFVELSDLLVRLAAVGEPEAGTDLSTRLQAVVDRLDKLEGTIADLMDQKVKDDDLPEDKKAEDAPEAGTVVDETKPEPKTAAYFTNARGVRVWHDPNSGKFAPAGFISPKVLAKLWKGDAKARRDLFDSVSKARAADPSLDLNGAVAKVLGPRPTDRTKALHWDSGKRALTNGWGATRPKSVLKSAPMKAEGVSTPEPTKVRDLRPGDVLANIYGQPLQRVKSVEINPSGEYRVRAVPVEGAPDGVVEQVDWSPGSTETSAFRVGDRTVDTRVQTQDRPQINPETGRKVLSEDPSVLKASPLKDDITESLERLMGGAGAVDQVRFDEALAAYDPKRHEGLPQIPFPDGVLSSPDQSERERQVPNAMAVLAYTQMASDSLRALADDPNWSDRTTVGPAVLRTWADLGDKMSVRLVENLAVTPMGSARRNEIEKDMAVLQDAMGSAIDSVDRPAGVTAIQKLMDKVSPGAVFPAPWALFHDRSDDNGVLPSVDPALAERERGLDELNRQLAEGLAGRGLLKGNKLVSPASMGSESRARAAKGGVAQRQNTSAYPVDVLPVVKPSDDHAEAPGAGNLAAVRGYRGINGDEVERRVPRAGETIDVYRDLMRGGEHKRGFPDRDAFSLRQASGYNGNSASRVVASSVGVELSNPRVAWASAEKNKVEADPKNTRGVHAFLRGEVAGYLSPDEAAAAVKGDDFVEVTYYPGTQDFFLPGSRERVIGGERAIATQGRMYVKNPVTAPDLGPTPLSALEKRTMGDGPILKSNKMVVPQPDFGAPDDDTFDVDFSVLDGFVPDMPKVVPSDDEYGMFTPEGNAAVADVLRQVEDAVDEWGKNHSVNKQTVRAFAVPRFKELKQQHPEVSDTEVRETTGDVLDAILGKYVDAWDIDSSESYDLFGDAPNLPGMKSDRMAGPVVRPMDGQMANTAMKQIGTMNVMAISGGRSRILSDGTLDLPVAKGYHVNIALMGDDTYRVQRVYGIGNVKGERSGVTADQLGEVSYQASNFSDGPFGDKPNSTPVLQSNSMSTENVTMTPEMQRNLTSDTSLSDAVALDVADEVNAGLAAELQDRGIEPGDGVDGVVWDELFSDAYYERTGVRLNDSMLEQARNTYGSPDLSAGGDGPILKSNAMKVPTANGTRDVKLVEVPLTGPDDPFIYRKQFDVVDTATGQVIGRTRQDATGAWSGDTETLTDNNGTSISVQNQYDRRGDALRMMIEQFDAQGGGDAPVLKSNQARIPSRRQGMTDREQPRSFAESPEAEGMGDTVSLAIDKRTDLADKASAEKAWEDEFIAQYEGFYGDRPTRAQARKARELYGFSRQLFGPSDGPVLKSDQMAADVANPDLTASDAEMRGRRTPALPVVDSATVAGPNDQRATLTTVDGNLWSYSVVRDGEGGPTEVGLSGAGYGSKEQAEAAAKWAMSKSDSLVTAGRMKADTPARPLAEMPEGTELYDGTTTWTKGADGNWSGVTFGGAAGSRADKLSSNALQEKFDRAAMFRSNAMMTLDESGRAVDVEPFGVYGPRERRGYTPREAQGYTDDYLLRLLRTTQSPVLRAEAQRRGLL